MVGENASKVVLDLKGIEDETYSYKRGDDWVVSIKAAIKQDLSDEGCDSEKWLSEELWRFGYACEGEISNLLFTLKWAIRDLKRSKERNQEWEI